MRIEVNGKTCLHYSLTHKLKASVCSKDIRKLAYLHIFFQDLLQLFVVS